MIKMRSVNRGLVTIIPKQPYYDWANQVDSEDNLIMTIENRIDHCSYFLKEYGLNEDPNKALKKNWKLIFMDELLRVSFDHSEWPPKLTWKLFAKWFDFHFSSRVIDLDDGVE